MLGGDRWTRVDDSQANLFVPVGSDLDAHRALGRGESRRVAQEIRHSALDQWQVERPRDISAKGAVVKLSTRP